MKSHLKKFAAAYGFLGGIASTLLVLWLIFYYAILAFPLPWKVIDPNHPRFDPEKFDFNDRFGNLKYNNTYSCLFPIGTPKSYVDRILVEIGGAKIKKYGKPIQETYHPNEYLYYRDIVRDKI